MAGFDPQSPRGNTASHPHIKRNARYGLILFFIYLAFYGGFVALNAFAPSFVEETKIRGINLAVLYGLTLIAAAILLALVYAWLCRTKREPGPVTNGKEIN